MKFIVELEPGVWLAPWNGDPGRTTVKENAKRFDIRYFARIAGEEAQKYRSFFGWRVCEVEE
ncbi:MAG TPA: hypothetical protein VJ248_09770 [Candidatus Udaeobacter sp.]|nr:hypothetical protein [Candidatus Udaeobacter sp.]